MAEKKKALPQLRTHHLSHSALCTAHCSACTHHAHAQVHTSHAHLTHLLCTPPPLTDLTLLTALHLLHLTLPACTLHLRTLHHLFHTLSHTHTTAHHACASFCMHSFGTAAPICAHCTLHSSAARYKTDVPQTLRTLPPLHSRFCHSAHALHCLCTLSLRVSWTLSRLPHA